MNVRQTFERPVPRLGLSVQDLALSLGVSPNTVLRMVEEGALPPPRVWHRRKIWRVAEIDAALSQWPIDRDAEPDGEEIGAGDDWRAET